MVLGDFPSRLQQVYLLFRNILDVCVIDVNMLLAQTWIQTSLQPCHYIRHSIVLSVKLFTAYQNEYTTCHTECLSLLLKCCRLIQYSLSHWPGAAYLLLNNNKVSLFYQHSLHAWYSNSHPTYLISLCSLESACTIQKVTFLIVLRPVTLLLSNYLCWRLGDAGGWGHWLSGCSMLGAREKNRGGEVSVGMRYPRFRSLHIAPGSCRY